MLGRAGGGPDREGGTGEVTVAQAGSCLGGIQGQEQREGARAPPGDTSGAHCWQDSEKWTWLHKQLQSHTHSAGTGTRDQIQVTDTHQDSGSNGQVHTESHTQTHNQHAPHRH